MIRVLMSDFNPIIKLAYRPSSCELLGDLENKFEIQNNLSNYPKNSKKLQNNFFEKIMLKSMEDIFKNQIKKKSSFE